MFCKNCGKEIPDNSIACTNCGAPTGNVEDTGSLGWCLLGCCIPMAGLILYFVWKDQKPKTAKKCIIGFLLNFVFAILYGILVFIFTSISAMSSI